MRCCDCEFRKECKEVEPDTVSFKLCGTRIEKLADKLLAEKLERIKKEDETNSE